MHREYRLRRESIRLLRFHSNLWFIPTVMTATALVLAAFLVLLDAHLAARPDLRLRWVFHNGPDGARGVLETIAGSMVTVAGTVFSVVIVALTLASLQFSPRILRNFMQDQINQIVLGAFIATFAYSLLVLSTVKDTFVPVLAVSVAMLLALGCTGLLISFIHHTAESIQASAIIARIHHETIAAIDRLFPEGEAAEVEACPEPPKTAPAVLKVLTTGYLQKIDEAAVIRAATAADVVLRMERRIGDFVILESPLFSVWPAERLNRTLSQRLSRTIHIGDHATIEQNARFGIRQIVDIAVRSLSPAVNDPTTAVTCVDFLGPILCRLAERQTPTRTRADAHGGVRLFMRVPTFAEFVETAFNQIREYGQSDVAVTLRLLETLTRLGERVQDSQQRTVLWQHVCLIASGADRGIWAAHDRAAVNARLQQVAQTLDLGHAPAYLLPLRSDSPDS